MVISNIKLGFARKKVAALLRKRTFSAGSNEVKSIAVLVDTDDVNILKEFQDLQHLFSIEDKDFIVVFVTALKAEKDDFEGIVVSPSEITWSGDFRSKDVSEFVNREYDVLISFAKDENTLLDLLVQASAARLKVGREQAGSGIYDLVISTGFDEPDIFIKELHKYLKILN